MVLISRFGLPSPSCKVGSKVPRNEKLFVNTAYSDLPINKDDNLFRANEYTIDNGFQ